MGDLKHNASHQVLLVDHQNEASRNMAFLLQLAGYEVITAAGLDEAINTVSTFCSKGDCPPVVLLNNPGSTADLQQRLDLLANHCPCSNILIVRRSETGDRLDGLKQQVISPHHILTEVRKKFAGQIKSNDVSEYFFRFHSMG